MELQVEYSTNPPRERTKPKLKEMRVFGRYYLLPIFYFTTCTYDDYYFYSCKLLCSAIAQKSCNCNPYLLTHSVRLNLIKTLLCEKGIKQWGLLRQNCGARRGPPPPKSLYLPRMTKTACLERKKRRKSYSFTPFNQTCEGLGVGEFYKNFKITRRLKMVF